MVPPKREDFPDFAQWVQAKFKFKSWVKSTFGNAGLRPYFTWKRTGIWISPEKEDKDMAKQVVHVGVALATDGPLPGRDNILAIGATIGGSQDFTINVKPPVYKSSPLWDKHPEEFKVLQKDAISLANAMDGFDQWLKKSQGRLIACTSNLDFWHLFISMMEHLGGCPFGSIPIDTNSFYCGYNGLKTPGKITDKVLPLDIAKERWLLVTEGRMPQFGPVKMKHRKSALDADYPPPLPRIIESFQPTPLNQPRATSQATIAYGHFTLGNPDR